MANVSLYPETPETSLVIQIAEVSQYLADTDNANQKVYYGSSQDDRLSSLLYIARKSLSWAFGQDPNYDGITFVKDYTYALCGPYISQALEDLGGPAGTVIPSTGNPLGWEWYREDFTIGDVNRSPRYPFVEGDQSYTIPLSGFLRNSVNMYASGPLMQIGDGGFNVQSVIYNPDFVTIVLSDPVVNGLNFTVEGVRAGAVVSPGGGGSSGLPVPFKRGEVLTNSGNAAYWNDYLVELTSADFDSSDGVSCFKADFADFTLAIYFNDLNRWLLQSEFVLIQGGSPISTLGFKILIDGFDARVNQYTFKVFKKSFS